MKETPINWQVTLTTSSPLQSISISGHGHLFLLRTLSVYGFDKLLADSRTINCFQVKALKEIDHTVGGGTSLYWGQLVQNGVCIDVNANKPLPFLVCSSSAMLPATGSILALGVNGAWADIVVCPR